jgi:hypothetical protein
MRDISNLPQHTSETLISPREVCCVESDVVVFEDVTHYNNTLRGETSTRYHISCFSSPPTFLPHPTSTAAYEAWR